MTERPFTVASAAKHLDCSAAHIRKLCTRGILRHFRLGGDAKGPIRIPASAMEEFECGSSISGEGGTPTSVGTGNRDVSAWGRRIVRLRNDG